MQVREVSRLPDRLPSDDDHPYRTGAWRPNFVEYDADDLDVVEGVLPAELDGAYLRNTENPVMPALGRYHPFDGDGMLHAIRFAHGRATYTATGSCCTAGLAAARLAAGCAALWAGIADAPATSLRDGWGARTRMKDASSTDVVVHAGRALTTFYQCGDVYQHDPTSLADRGPAAWAPPGGGVGAHEARPGDRRADLLRLRRAATVPVGRRMVDRDGAPVHRASTSRCRGRGCPHDLAFTEHYIILNDLPLYWDPDQIARGVYRARWHPGLPSRFGVLPRRGRDVRWFEATPTYVLHWINAYEDGDTIVLDGYHQADPLPRPDPADGPYAALKRMVDLNAMQARPHRWRFDLATGACREERLFDAVSEFPSIHYARPGRRHRYVWSMTAKPGWFLFDGIVRMDLETGDEQRWRYPDGVYASEAPMAPRPGASAEDDGWIVTFVSDCVRERSECHVFDAARICDGPVARVALPERICAGTHACWAPAATL